MKSPVSSHFTAVSLAASFTHDRVDLPEELQAVDLPEGTYGNQSVLGIPFVLGQPDQTNVILLDQEQIVIDLANITATYLLFLHVVEDRTTNYQDNFADFALDGNELGDMVSDYMLEYEDGVSHSTPILRRFAIQQSQIAWGASPFAAMPATKPPVFPTVTDEQALGRVPRGAYGRGETRTSSPRDSTSEKLWVYALPNPHPDKPISRLVLTPKNERSAIYGLAHTQLTDHPLRPSVRQKCKLTLPEGITLNAINELESLTLDLGTVISARAALKYDQDRWFGDDPQVQPELSEQEVIVEYIAHPKAKLYLQTGDDTSVAYDLAMMNDPAVETVEAALKPVHIRVIDQATKQPVAVRLHLHGQAGEYLPPKGYHRKVNPYWFEDNYGEFVNHRNQYAYILGDCVADLPLGEVFIEITKGYEIKPIRTSFTVQPDTDEITFELERVLQWRERGWVTADTHVHFLTPQTALLEGAAEGVNVVNLLASQWGEMFSNVTDFDGRTTLGAKDFGGDGEFLVRVGTENRMQVLGHISLLGYSGAMIHPLCSGGPSESALGDAQEVSMAQWAQRCIDQGGLVVMPHGPNPQCERAADIVLGLIHAIEMMTFNPHDAQINPYGLADWYRYLNLGYHVPIAGGSDKMSASSLLGGIRTYAHLADREFTYENWIEAVQAGNTFATVGPLAELLVDGLPPGSKHTLPTTGGTVDVTWKVESVSVPIDQVEVIVGGLVVSQVNADKKLMISGETQVSISDSTWIALRVRGSYKGEHGEIAAHTSAVQVLVEGKPLFSNKDATAVLEQIEGAIAYVDTLAPRPDALRFKQLRATLESAHIQLHQRMHQQGIYHQHTPLHQHDRPHEH
ncbi:MAG: CehA/McbA family metallohydrolase [Chloroflexota bacterium]